MNCTINLSTFEEEKDFLQKIFHIPKKYFTFPKWDFPGFKSIFGNDNPIQVEYCSGNGSWIIHKAKENPFMNWVAIEMKMERAKKIWKKRQKENLQNLWIIGAEGYKMTKEYFPDNSVSSVYINFPDPWPKRRHAKNRIIQLAFINEIERILKNQGKCLFVTDDEEYSQIFIDSIKEAKNLWMDLHVPYQTKWDGYGTSFFSDLWQEKGKIIRYHSVEKK